MRRLLILLLMSMASFAWAETPPAMPKDDVRMIRDIESRVFGKPTLDTDAPRGEDLLALADLSATYQSGNLQNQDYNALFALLQRYRDELLKMGLDASELDTQIRNLEIRTDEMKARLDKLKPVDGLKIDGKLFSSFDDLHLLGAEALLSDYTLAPKPGGQGLRYQYGSNFADLDMTLTRGPFTGQVDFDTQQTWGLSTFGLGMRRIYLEARLPLVVQMGDIYVGESPLTLWRNEDEEPFMPEPFADRQQRLEDDMLLVPNKWMVTGARLSTLVTLFGSLDIELEDAAGIVGNQAYSFGSASNPPVIYTSAFGEEYIERFATYLDSWHVLLPFFEKKFNLAYYGNLFWDNTDTSPGGVNETSMNELVQSVKADLKAGIFVASVEYGLSSYSNPQYVSDPAAAPMTGTALVYSAGIQGSAGQLVVFGGMVDASYHAAGAQGRTQDGGYEYLGGAPNGFYYGGLWPFATEDNQLNALGGIGLSTGYEGIPVQTSYASRLNNTLIPPGGSYYKPGTAQLFVTNETINPWSYLLLYDIGNFIDPYGPATPNRSGYGVKGDWKIFGGLLDPMASYEVDNESQPTAVTTTNYVDYSPTTVYIAPFNMSRMRVGLGMNLKPLLNWPVRAIGGYTVSSASNGTTDTTGANYSLATTQIDAGIEWDLEKNMGINFGYRHLDASGISDAFYIPNGGMALDMFGYGYWWKPIDTLRLDAVYTQSFQNYPSVSGMALEVDQGSLRVALGF